MRKMKSMMSLQVWLHKSHHWQSHSRQLTLYVIWLYSALMSQSSPAYSKLFQMFDCTFKLNNATHSGVWRLHLTSINWKVTKAWIVKATADMWFVLNEVLFLDWACNSHSCHIFLIHNISKMNFLLFYKLVLWNGGITCLSVYLSKVLWFEWLPGLYL